MRLFLLLLALLLVTPQLSAQAVSGPSSVTTNAVPSFQDNKHLKDNPLVTIVGGHLYISGAPVLTNAAAGITFSVNGASSSAPNLTNTSTLAIYLTSTNVTFWPTNLTDAQIAAAAAIAQSKISGLVSDLAAKLAKSGDTMSAGGLTNRFDGFAGNGVNLTNIPASGVTGLTTGTVTSVAMTVPSQFAVSGSPITTSGTLALTLTNSTGTGKVALDTDPSLTRPALAGATWSGSTTNSNGTASRFLTLDSAKVVSTTGASADLAATLSDETGTGLAVFGTDPSLTRPALAGATLSGSTTNSAGTASRFVTLDSAKALSNTGASADLAATLSDETGTGLAVFNTDPSLTRPAIAGATISGTTTNTSIFSGTFTNTGAAGFSTNVITGGQILAEDGTAVAPAYAFGSATNYGIRLNGGVLSFSIAGNQSAWVAASGVINLNNSAGSYQINSDTVLGREGAAIWQLGSDATGQNAPTAQTLKGPDSLAGTATNIAGANLTIAAGRNTGSAAGGSLLFQTAPAGSTGTAAGTLTTRLTIDSTGLAQFAGNVGVTGTTTLSGAVTAPSIVVTNATTTGTLTVGGGTSILKVISATATLDFPNTLAQTDSDLTITLTGAALGDVVDLGVPNGSTQAGSCFSAWVSSANTVTVRFSVYGLAAKDPASGTFRVAANP